MDQTTCGSLAYENNFANQQASPQIKHIRPYRLAHQALCLTQIDFDQCIVIGFTQMTIWPLVNNLRWLHINCRQCRIHRIMLEPAGDPSDSNDFDSTGSSVVTRGNLHSSHHNSLPNPMDLPVVYNDPSIEICKRDSKLRTLDSFQRRHTAVVSMADADEGMGEVTIRLPLSYWSFIAAKGPLRITLEFSLTRPKAGFYFVIPAKDGQIYDADDRGIHAFTSASPNSSRLWFPCIDSSEPCTWKIEITVDEDMVAVAPGDLLEAPHYTEDLKRKTYHFYVAVPVSAPCIGLAIGAFDIFPDTRLPNLATHFAPKGLLPILKHTVKPIADIIEYYESLLASEFPFSTMKLVFVDQAYEAEFQSYASLIILPVDLLHSSRIIEQTIATRRILAQAVASQIFGCFIGMHTWCDAWLPLGLAGYLAGLYQRRVFGNNEYRHTTATQMRYVTNFEHTKHGIILDASQTLPVKKTTYFNLKLPQVISPDHRVAYVKKAHLVIRMLEIRLGQPVLMQVLNKLLVLARLSAVSNLYCSGESILNLGPICLDQSSSDSSNGLNSIQSQCLTKTTSHTKFSIPPGTDFAHASCPHDLVDREFKTGDTEELARSGKRASVCLVKGPASASLDTGILLSGASPNEDLLSPSSISSKAQFSSSFRFPKANKF